MKNLKRTVMILDAFQLQPQLSRPLQKRNWPPAKLKKAIIIAAAALALALPCARAEIAREDIFAWWPMDFNDDPRPRYITMLPGGYRIKVPDNVAVRRRPGRFGHAIEFNGHSLKAELPKQFEAVNGFTVAFFFKGNPASPPDRAYVFSLRNRSGSHFKFYMESRIRTFLDLRILGRLFGFGILSSELSDAQRQWEHMAFAIAGPDQVLMTRSIGQKHWVVYKNGAASGGSFNPNDRKYPEVVFTDIQIGGDFDGRVDDIAVFNRGLHEEEVKALYDGELQQYLFVQPKGKLAETWAALKNDD